MNGERVSDSGTLPELAAIWAQAGNGVIGRNGDMPWYAPEDLAHFKALTLGAPVIMGRVTWESFPPRFRPLPGRLNLVITRSVSQVEEKDGAVWAPSLNAALGAVQSLAPDAPTYWIIGGGSLYTEALHRTDLPGVASGQVARVERTLFEAEIPGDTYAPELGADWALVADGAPVRSEKGYALTATGEKLPLTMRFQTLRREPVKARLKP
ncbi:dihydrofolate reductase [Rothia nasimurium]|uniref:dihydrofolate reductase n=1 Tax=Rothia nasimurium TaxID=85336 RepID=UPI002DD67867|nr:dihydrofolate reductase [Rothia nasimurium]